MAGTRSVQLQCPRYRKHGSAHTFWCRRTQGAVAETVAGGHDPLGLRDDRAVAPRYVSADSVRWNRDWASLSRLLFGPDGRTRTGLLHLAGQAFQRLIHPRT